MAPYRLDEGVVLEDSDTLLPWGSSVSRLRHVGHPEAVTEPSRLRLYWTDRRCLGGLACQVMTDDGSPGNAGGRLQLVTLYPTVTRQESARDSFVRVRDHLLAGLGPPHRDDGTAAPYGWPQAEWDLDDVLVFHFIVERFGEICCTEIWHKPLPGWRRPELL